MSHASTVEQITSWVRQTIDEAGAKGVVVGLSGGIDSAVVAALCRRVFEREQMLGVIMPCESLPHDSDDALTLAVHCDIRTVTVGLDPLYHTLLRILPEGPAMARANLKPRIRMMCVHYLANTHGFLVAGTGNRSELEIGYFTKYGDGGVDFLPIGDLYKDEVFELAAELDIPEEIINRPPSAGLWPRQTDEGEMGMTYRDLNQALRALDAGQTDSIDPAVLDRVKEMNRRSEHKRQMPPICRIQR